MRGRLPKPNAKKRLTGKPGKRPLKGPVEAPTTGLHAPAHLTAVAKRIWKTIAPTVDGMGLLTEADRDSLGILCQLLAQIRRLYRLIEKEGEMVSATTLDSHGAPVERIKPHPAIATLRGAEREARALQDRFGLNPVSRVRIPTDKTNKRDEFEDYLNGIDPPTLPMTG